MNDLCISEVKMHSPQQDHKDLIVGCQVLISLF